MPLPTTAYQTEITALIAAIKADNDATNNGPSLDPTNFSGGETGHAYAKAFLQYMVGQVCVGMANNVTIAWDANYTENALKELGTKLNDAAFQALDASSIGAQHS